MSSQPQWAKAHFFVGFRTSGTMRESVASKIEEIAQRVAESEGLEIVEVEVKGGGQAPLRPDLDRQAGRRHATRDCELVSQQVGTILDVEDVVPGGRYTLEVSSPGVERKLLKPAGLRALSGEEGQDHAARADRRPAQLGRHARRHSRTASSGSKPERGETRPVPVRPGAKGQSEVRVVTRRKHNSHRDNEEGTLETIFQSIEILSKEKGIDPQIVLDAVKDAMLIAARKHYRTNEDYVADMDPKTGAIAALRGEESRGSGRRSGRTK